MAKRAPKPGSPAARQYEIERNTLSKYAFLTENTRGRDKPISPDDSRTEFQRDRDRIIHSKSFRRLMHKTQVFLSPEGDHYRTRLTHTLEVTQIARSIARALGLNEDLTEAISLGHDLGHTPFGHAGERVLQRCFDPDFTHYKQSLRVATLLERDGEGLNLTWEVRDGILNHSGGNRAMTLEGRVVNLADRIAYINHDIDDACRAGVLSLSDIPVDISAVLGKTHGQRIDTMVQSTIKASTGQNDISMEPQVYSATMRLRAFLFEHVYTNPIAKGEEGRAEAMLEALYNYYNEHPEDIPAEQVRRYTDGIDPLPRVVCDYVSSMTDRYALEMYKKHFIPVAWRKN